MAITVRLPHPEGGALLLRHSAVLSRREALEAALALDPKERSAGRAVAVGDIDGVLKAEPVSRSGARRHGVRRLWGSVPPRLAEFAQLEWLRARLFRAAEPLVAASRIRWARVEHQMLITRRVVDSRPVHEFVEDHPQAARALAVELGRELGRLHALGFQHADLYPRNVLVAPPENGHQGGRRLVFIDCWAAGPAHWRRSDKTARGNPRDLGQWMVDGARIFARDEQREWLDAYFAARRANGRPVEDERALLDAAQRARRADLRRLERDRGRLRGRPFPLAGWEAAHFVAACMSSE